MKAAVVVAHPDDEIIWCGGYVLTHPEWDWTVMALARAGDPDRAPRFKNVCAHIGAESHISDLDDGEPLAPIDPAADIGGRVLAALAAERWDLVLTHGPNGEYGHPRHVETHEAVETLVRSGKLTAGELLTFAYECDPSTGECVPAPWADISMDLAPDIITEKRRIVRDLYGFGPGSFEARAAGSPECFRRLRR